MQNKINARQNGRRRVNNRSRFSLKRTLTIGVFALCGIIGTYTLAFTDLGAPTRAWVADRAVTLAANLGYRVDNIYVEGRVNAEADLIKTLVGLKRGDPILAFDPSAARVALQKISWVRDANVRRQLPNTIYIDLVERQPLALWQENGKVRVIDRDGVVLTNNLAPFHNLPLVVGPGAPAHAAELLAEMAAEPDLAAHFVAAMWVGDRRWDLAFKNNIVVKLPQENIGLALRKLADSQETDHIFSKDIAGIDLREPDRFVIRTNPGVVEEYKASFTPRKSLKGDEI